MTRNIAIVIGLYVAFLAHVSFACEAVSEDMHLEHATAAFTGTISASKGAQGRETDEVIEFRVDKVYRGNIAGPVTVIAPAHPCRYKQHAAGETWLIIGELGDDGKIRITWDSPSVKLANADGTPTNEDIAGMVEKLR
jgi:hypothetical protein